MQSPIHARPLRLTSLASTCMPQLRTLFQMLILLLLVLDTSGLRGAMPLHGAHPIDAGTQIQSSEHPMPCHEQRAQVEPEAGPTHAILRHDTHALGAHDAGICIDAGCPCGCALNGSILIGASDHLTAGVLSTPTAPRVATRPPVASFAPDLRPPISA